MAIHLGLGSWADDEYVGVLYPKGLAKTARLQTYATRFDRVELNNTYYTTPSAAQMSGWAAQTPDGFRFDYKLPKDLSRNPAATGSAPARIAAAVKPLQETGKLGCFLLTLAPSFGPGSHQLEEIAALQEKLPAGVPIAVELRHRDWVATPAAQTATLDFFRQHKLAWVALDYPPIEHSAILPVIDEVTSPALAYLRLHGRNPDWAKGKTAEEKHRHDYSAAELKEVAQRIRALATKAKDVHVSLNNHAEDFAPKAALALKELLNDL